MIAGLVLGELRGGIRGMVPDDHPDDVYGLAHGQVEIYHSINHQSLCIVSYLNHSHFSRCCNHILCIALGKGASRVVLLPRMRDQDICTKYAEGRFDSALKPAKGAEWKKLFGTTNNLQHNPIFSYLSRGRINLYQWTRKRNAGS